MPRKKQVPVIPEVQFMQPDEPMTQEARALSLAVNHAGDAKTYVCKVSKRTVKVKVWESVE